MQRREGFQLSGPPKLMIYTQHCAVAQYGSRYQDAVGRAILIGEFSPDFFIVRYECSSWELIQILRPQRVVLAISCRGMHIRRCQRIWPIRRPMDVIWVTDYRLTRPTFHNANPYSSLGQHTQDQLLSIRESRSQYASTRALSPLFAKPYCIAVFYFPFQIRLRLATRTRII
jgi:hypothetical protein